MVADVLKDFRVDTLGDPVPDTDRRDDLLRVPDTVTEIDTGEKEEDTV